MSARHSTRICAFEGCGKKHYGKGFCAGHYQQLIGHGILCPLRSGRPNGSPPIIEVDERPCPNQSLAGPCHVYRGTITQKGYGQTSINGKSVMVHRYVWEQTNGPIPKGLEIDHQCRVRACCNVQHLRVVTKKVNLTENVVGSCWQLLKARTHCPLGHPYDEANTYRNKFGCRSCRSCNRIKQARRRERNRNESV